MNGVRRKKIEELDEMFDVTKVNGQWLNKEDEEFYKLQIETKGQVGYSTCKYASPSKRRRPAEAAASSSAQEDCPETDCDTDTCDGCDSNEESP